MRTTQGRLHPEVALHRLRTQSACVLVPQHDAPDPPVGGVGFCRLPDDVDRTVDLCWVTAQHGAYTLLVRDCGWTQEAYRDMVLERFLELLDR